MCLQGQWVVLSNRSTHIATASPPCWDNQCGKLVWPVQCGQNALDMWSCCPHKSDTLIGDLPPLVGGPWAPQFWGDPLPLCRDNEFHLEWWLTCVSAMEQRVSCRSIRVREKLTISSGPKIPNWTLLTLLRGTTEEFNSAMILILLWDKSTKSTWGVLPHSTRLCLGKRRAVEHFSPWQTTAGPGKPLTVY